MKKLFSREIKNLEKISKSSFWGAHWKKNLYKYICINIYQIINLKINNNTCSMLNPGIFYYDSFEYFWFFYHFTFFFARPLRLKIPLGIIYFESEFLFLGTILEWKLILKARTIENSPNQFSHSYFKTILPRWTLEIHIQLNNYSNN